MRVGPRIIRLAIRLLLAATLGLTGRAQTSPIPSSTAAPATISAVPPEAGREVGDQAKPLPDIPTLMRDVEANQRKSEAVEKNYLYHSVETEQEVDSHGQVKKITVT